VVRCPLSHIRVEYLLRLLSDSALSANQLQGRWALQQDGQDGSRIRFDAGALYLVRTPQTPPVYEALAAIGVASENTEWVASGIGLLALPASRTEGLAKCP
jgi:hypothetical protein